MIRTAVIGYGGAFNMGKSHAEWMEAAGMPLVAACDTDPARIEAAKADFPAIKTYTKIDDLLKDPKVDLVVVILPHNLHASVAIAALDAGKHVVVEKPMCITVAEADLMIAARDRSGKMLTVFHNRRHDGDYLAMKEIIQLGQIGELFHIEACMGGYNAPGDWWRADKALSGGILYDWGAHIIDWITQLVPGEIAGIDGYLHKRIWHNSTNEDHGEIAIRFADGTNANVEISSMSAAGKSRWRILGTKGALVVAHWEDIKLYAEKDGKVEESDVPPKTTHWQAFYDNVAAHLERGAALEVKPEEARRTIGIIESAEQSSVAKHTIVPKYV